MSTEAFASICIDEGFLLEVTTPHGWVFIKVGKDGNEVTIEPSETVSAPGEKE